MFEDPKYKEEKPKQNYGSLFKSITNKLNIDNLISTSSDEDSVNTQQKVASQILQILNLRYKLELEPPKILRLYRAITGKYVPERLSRKDVFEGVETENLFMYGVFNSNMSFAQYGDSDYGIIDNSDFNPYRRVSGLPVSLNPSEAVNWLGSKSYLNKPAIVVLELPIDAVVGTGKQIKIVRNRLSRNFKDFELDDAMITHHITGEKEIRGECYINGIDNVAVPDEIRHFERILVPKSLSQDGKINYLAGFEEVDYNL